MNVIVFDTETTSLEKPFCYNVGYIILNVDTGRVYAKRDFVIEQIWHNLALFSSAYYADKREHYVTAMKARKTKMTKFGLCMRTLQADINRYNVKFGYAYNSSFDEKVFNFNCDWYKVNNPFDTVQVLDIRSFAIERIGKTFEYKQFCETHELFTESGNFSTTAESIYKFISRNSDFIESHTALADSEIETEILLYCKDKGSDITQKFGCPRSLERLQSKVLLIKENNCTVGTYHCKGYIVSKKKDTIYLK